MSRKIKINEDYEKVLNCTNNGLSVFLKEGIFPNQLICNPLRDDNSPSAKLLQSKSSNIWNLIDFSTEESINCVKFIQKRYDKTYSQAIKYCLDGKNPDSIISISKEYIPKEIIFEYTRTDFTEKHKNYWNILPEEFLNKFGIYAAKYIAINKNVELIPDNVLCFVYEPVDLEYGKLKILKIGVPKEEKWRNNLPKDYIYYTSDITDGDLILVAKSNKDALVNRFLGYKSCAVLSENSRLIIDNIGELQRKFPNSEIILNLGSDKQAVKTTNIVVSAKKIRSFTVPLQRKINDNFEWVKEKGLKSYERLLKKFI